MRQVQWLQGTGGGRKKEEGGAEESGKKRGEGVCTKGVVAVLVCVCVYVCVANMRGEEPGRWGQKERGKAPAAGQRRGCTVRPFYVWR